MQDSSGPQPEQSDDGNGFGNPAVDGHAIGIPASRGRPRGVRFLPEPRGARSVAMRPARAVQTALLCEAANDEPDGIEGQAALVLARLTGGPCL